MAMPQGTKWQTIKPQIAPPDKKKIKKHHKIFFRYMSERYKIKKRRDKGKKRPWTKDPILSDYHFTNVFRKDDKGSQWLLNHIKDPKVKAMKAEDLIWRVVMYRWANYHRYFEDYGWPARSKKALRKMLKRLEKYDEKKVQWFTRAHIVLQSNFNQPRRENYIEYAGLLLADFDSFVQGILGAENMERAFKHVQKFKGIGGFTAYEICIDLCYLGVLPDEFRDQYANPGPGCREGIDLIFPSASKSGTKGYIEAMETLRDEQDEAFSGYGLTPTPRLTLQDIEFNLCEISKYIKIMHGTGRGRRYR